MINIFLSYVNNVDIVINIDWMYSICILILIIWNICVMLYVFFGFVFIKILYIKIR